MENKSTPLAERVKPPSHLSSVRISDFDFCVACCIANGMTKDAAIDFVRFHGTAFFLGKYPSEVFGASHN